jgi:hypothetical protein
MRACVPALLIPGILFPPVLSCDLAQPFTPQQVLKRMDEHGQWLLISVTTMGPGPIEGSTSNVHSLGRPRVSAESSQSRSSAVFITVMNALQRNNMAADAVLANDRVVASSDVRADPANRRLAYHQITRIPS